MSVKSSVMVTGRSAGPKQAPSAGNVMDPLGGVVSTISTTTVSVAVSPAWSVTFSVISCGPSGRITSRVAPSPRKTSVDNPKSSYHSNDTMSSLVPSVESGSVEPEPSSVTVAPSTDTHSAC